MNPNCIRVPLKRKEISEEEKERNCRRRIGEFLSVNDDFIRPTQDSETLREWAEHRLMMIEMKKRTEHIVTESPKSPNTVLSSLGPISSNTTTSSRPQRFNHSFGCPEHRNVNDHMEVPPEVRAYIENIEGSENVKFVIEKKLTATDVNPAQSRLLMPFKQIPREDLEMPGPKEEVAVRLYVPEKREHYDLVLTEWDMKSTRNYSLKKGWNVVVKENQLRKNMVVQIWSFKVGSTLCIFLIPVDGGCCGGGT